MKKLNDLTRIGKAILKRMLERMLSFKSPYSDPWYRDDRSARSSLQKAIIYIKLGARFDAKSDSAGKILRTAAFQGDVEAIKYLLEKGVDINVVDKHKETALMLATIKHHREVVQLLLESGADIKIISDAGNHTAFSFAELWGDAEIIELFRARGA